MEPSISRACFWRTATVVRMPSGNTVSLQRIWSNPIGSAGARSRFLRLRLAWSVAAKAQSEAWLRRKRAAPSRRTFRQGSEKLIPRYTREEIGRVWSDANKFASWLDVELAATETLAEAGQVPKDAASAIRARAKIAAARINDLEARVKHDVIAFTMAVGESIADPAAARWLHYGMTSNDVVDTAQALLIRDASRLIEAALAEFGEVLGTRAQEFRDTPQIGRTHGIHAEPI